MYHFKVSRLALKSYEVANMYNCLLSKYCCKAMLKLDAKLEIHIGVILTANRRDLRQSLVVK